MPKELTREEINEIVTLFAQAAVRAKKAGFDGVEVHAAHAYLLAEFLSRFTNKRQDLYGGSLENRARILIEPEIRRK
jgi:2,4-dienoyl-CoA reductase-like NADH-dependent reductase (Old Yellow Enzyme family)